ncbi:MAG: alpha/beta hydrolase [Alcanivorax sp.]|nr:alpha/beta hydrolase [Alcanivorax sp.]
MTNISDVDAPPFDVSAIHGSWQALDWSSPQIISGEALRYARYYGIDFAERLPDMRHAFGYFEAAGHTLAVHAWLPPDARGTVLVMHGYFDHVGLYRHVIGHVLGLGYAVLAYDLPGHGLSSGPRAAVDDFLVYQEVLTHCLANKENGFPKPWHVVAQSTGCAIVMDYLVRHGAEPDQVPFDKIILLAPLVRPFAWRSGRLLHAVVSPFREYVKRVFTVNSNDKEFLHFLEHLDPLQHRALSARWVSALKKWIPVFERALPVKVPLIVVQGDMDDTVDWRHNLGIIEDKFYRPEIHVIKGARHQLANEHDSFRLQVLKVITTHLA